MNCHRNVASVRPARWFRPWRCYNAIHIRRVMNVDAALAGNLCRCGAYDNYLNGVMRAAGTGAA